jgi:hypothetical protein
MNELQARSRVADGAVCCPRSGDGRNDSGSSSAGHGMKGCPVIPLHTGAIRSLATENYFGKTKETRVQWFQTKNPLLECRFSPLNLR